MVDRKPIKLFIVAGEKSGDNHGARLIQSLKKLNKDCQVAAVGGDHIAEVSDSFVMDYKEINVMGVTEVISKLPSLYKKMQLIKSSIVHYEPDVLVLVDFGGMNLRLAKWAKSRGIKVAYYILPKAWAWNSSRIQKIKKYVDLPLSILPFEVDYFSRKGLKVHYVGNPSAESIQQYLQKNESSFVQGKVAIVPGSRRQEVKKILPILLASIRACEVSNYVITKAPNLPIELYTDLGASKERITSDFYLQLQTSQVALVTSGTATLETALLGVPQAVVYKTSPLTYWLAKRLIQVPFISLVNLIAGKKVVEELIQSNCTTKSISKNLSTLLKLNEKQRKAFYSSMHDQLQPNENAPSAANLILDLTKQH